MNTLPESRPLPAPVGAALGLLPSFPGSALLTAAINFTLAHHLPDDVKALLEGKRLAIRVLDARLAFDFTCMNGRFLPCAKSEAPDLTISANAQDFLLLAQRKQDPDTLFFNRRLISEGDTELGLVVKNALDALDLPAFDPAAWSPRAALDAFERFAPAPVKELAARLPKLPLPKLPTFMRAPQTAETVGV